MYGKVQNVTEDILGASRTSVALGRYTMNQDFDSWQGYLWDRQGSAACPPVNVGNADAYACLL